MKPPGRNDRCRCGSGKKYKRCCLLADEAAAPAAVPAPARVGGGLDAPAGADAAWTNAELDALPDGLDPSPYAMARLREGAAKFRELERRDPVQWARRSPTAVFAHTAEALQRRLAEEGIDASREAFLARAQATTSAWDVSRAWLAERPGGPAYRDEFVGLAACKLWAHLCPERPSIELLDDWMQEGYAHEEGQDAQTADVWLRLWETLRGRFTPGMRTLDAAEPLVRGRQSLFNWAQDLSLVLRSAAEGDATYAERGAAFLRQLLAQFPDEHELLRRNARSGLGELLERCGRPDEAEQTLRELLREQPEQTQSYVALADLLETRGQRDEALALLEQARDRPTVDPRDWDLPDRIADLKAEIAAAPGAGG